MVGVGSVFKKRLLPFSLRLQWQIGAFVNIAALAPFPLKSLLTKIRCFHSAGIVPWNLETQHSPIARTRVYIYFWVSFFGPQSLGLVGSTFQWTWDFLGDGCSGSATEGFSLGELLTVDLKMAFVLWYGHRDKRIQPVDRRCSEKQFSASV